MDPETTDEKIEKLKVHIPGSEGITYDTDNWVPSDGLQYGGTIDSMDPPDMDVTQSFEVGQLSFNFEEDLRKKYPALNDAWEHYQNVKQMCETREKEEEDA